MKYHLTYNRRAVEDLEKFDPKIRMLLLAWIEENLLDCSDPRSIPGGKALIGTPGGWRWRIGSYRIVGLIEDERITIQLIRTGNRKDVYRNLDIKDLSDHRM